MSDSQSDFFKGSLDQIINAVADPLFVKDRRHRWVVFNDAFAKLMGRAPHELLGKSDYDFLPKEQADIFWEKDELVFNTNRENVNEEKITGADGMEHWIVTKKTIFSSNGESFLVGIIRDITEMKRAEEKLRRSEQLLSTVFSSLNDAVLVVDNNTRNVINCNEAAERIFGYSREEIIGGDTRKIHIDEETYQMNGLKWQSAMKLQGFYDGEFYLRRKNNELFPAECFLRAASPSEGGSSLMVAVVHDISQRKKAEEARARLSQVVEQATESIVITDIGGKIIYVNPAFERISGYRREELLGQNPRITRSGSHDAEFYRNLWETISKGDIWRGRITNRRKDGTLFEEEAIISPVREDSGRIISFAAIKRDITEQIEMEQRLMQAQKMDAVGRLAGGVAHDFNNLLTSILGFAQMVLDQLDPKLPMAEDVKEIMKAGERAAGLTQQLLTFSRKQVMDPRMLDLNSAVMDMENMLKRTIGEDVRLTMRPSKDGWVKMDPNQVSQLVVNLALNARDAMPKGGQLAIEMRNEHIDEKLTYRQEQIPPGDYVTLSVSDTGSGMTKEVQAHLFEPFFTTKPKGRGTGLGLATVYGIVKQNNGFITIYTETGKGTTIRIYLPRQAGGGAAGHPGGGEVAHEVKGTETILLVEDEATVRMMAQRSLEGRGYRVLPCENGQRALQVLREEKGPIHLLLTDVVMPEMSGPALAEEIRKFNSQIPVMFMSGYTNEMIAAHGVLEDGLNFIQKPFTPGKLLQKVQEVLGASKKDQP